MKNRRLDIGEVAKASGLPASTLRFYEEKGLIRPDGRNGLRRQYGADVLDRLALISLGRMAGFTLDELVEMFSMDRLEIDRTLLLAKAEQLERQIKELGALRDSLRHAAACGALNHFECPKFLRLLRVAGKNRFRPAKSLPESRRRRPA